MKKVIRGGTVVNARETATADVLIDGEQVVAVGQIGPVEGADEIDAGGHPAIVVRRRYQPISAAPGRPSSERIGRAVAFEGGDLRRPFVIGALWNGRDAPPQQMDGSAQNNLKVLRSRNGVKLTMDDSQGQEQFILETPGGQKVTLKDGPGAIDIEDSNGNSVKLETSGITVNASAKVTVQASLVEVSASMVTVDAGMSKFSGVVKADTVICNSIISASYTPGAGNIW